MTVSLTYYVFNEPTHFSASGYSQLGKYVRRIIVVNYVAYSCLTFGLLDHDKDTNPSQPETTCKIKVACCKQKNVRKSGEWLEDFYGNKTGVSDWYTTYGISAIARQANLNSCL